MPITDAELVDRARDLLVKADPGEVDRFTFRGATCLASFSPLIAVMAGGWCGRRPWSTCGLG
jgi:hypothetical protein